jgi:4-amino-4-deoxy-L-arabinose transferase-like glycosyltransferase
LGSPAGDDMAWTKPSFRDLRSAVLVVAAGCLVLRLFGMGVSWLPPAGELAVLLAGVHLLFFLPWGRIGAEWRSVLWTHRFGAGLVLLAALALAVRIPGFDSDLGHVPIDIDENRFASNVKDFFVTGQVGHETVEHYPGVVFWMFSGASFLSFLRGVVGGNVAEPRLLPVEVFVQAARAVNIGVAAGIVAATGCLGYQLSGRKTGLLAALLVAVVPLSVETTRVARNDPGMLLFVLAAVCASLAAHRDPRRAWFLAGGVAAGLAGAVKYSAVFAIVPPLIAAVASSGTVRIRVQRAAVALAAFLLAVAVSNHFLWADFPRFLAQLAFQVAITGPGHWAASENPAAFYAFVLSRFGPGLPVLLFAGGFAVYGLSTRNPGRWIALSFPLMYVWFMTQRPSQFPRWVFPVTPFVAVAGCAALLLALRTVRKAAAQWPTLPRLAAGVACGALVLGVLWSPLWAGAVSFSRVVRPKTYKVTEDWLKQNAEPGSTVVLGDGWLDLRDSQLVVRRVSDLNGALDAGLDRFAGCQWIVVPEPFFGHPTLARLGVVQRVHAGRDFGGREGHDFEVYAVPRLPFGGACQPEGPTEPGAAPR